MAIRTLLLRILKHKNIQRGFTLIELLVVIGMLGVLIISLIVTFNPLEQYNKALDGQREHDLGQIQRALDAYFNDTGCYPTSLIFGTKWSNGAQVYMEQIPQDPDCSKDVNKCYVYETDTTSNCPQWNVLYASLHSSAVPANACPLATRTACLPSNYSSAGFNYCIPSGAPDCSVISGYSIPQTQGSGGAGGGGGSGGSGGAPTPTGGTSGPISCPGDNYYGCTGDNRCNSIFPSSQCSQNGGTIYCSCDQHCNQTCAFN